MLTAVLLELEGVVVETATARAAALAQALADEGVGDAADLAALDETTRDLVTLRARRHFAGRVAGGVTLVPGAPAALERLAARVPVGVVTRATRREADLLLGGTPLRDLVAFVVTADDARAKPSPAAYALARRRLQARLGERVADGVVALEDSGPGIDAAAAAGLAVVAVGTVPAHEALRASGSIDSLAELTVDQLERVAGLVSGRPA